MPIQCYNLHNAKTVFGQIFSNVKHKSTLGLARTIKFSRLNQFSLTFLRPNANKRNFSPKWPMSKVRSHYGGLWEARGQVPRVYQAPPSRPAFWFPTNKEHSSIGTANQPLLELLQSLGI